MTDKEDDKTEDKTEDKKTDPWEKLGGVVRTVVQEELKSWQESRSSEGNKQEDEKQEDKKPERKKGFLETWFEGLS